MKMSMQRLRSGLSKMPGVASSFQYGITGTLLDQLYHARGCLEKEEVGLKRKLGGLVT